MSDAPRIRSAAGFCLLLPLLLLLQLGTVQAETAPPPPGRISMLIQNSPLAGSQYHALDEVWGQLAPGMRLELQAEPDNPHDPQAVQVRWQGQLLGYLPRRENGVVSRALAAGEVVEARIARLREHRNPWRRLEIEVYLRL